MPSIHERRFSKYHEHSSVKKLVLMASSVAFEINKATIKLRRSLNISPNSSPKSTTKRDKIALDSTLSTTRCSKKNRQLCAELSSFALYPLFGALSPSHFSSPNLLFQSEKRSNTTISNLSDSEICRIIAFLDSKSIMSLSKTCQRMRLICKCEEGNFPKIDMTSHELVISFNQIKRSTEVRMKKRDRTRNDVIFVGPSISSMIPLYSRVLTRITFETSVFLSDWIEEICRLHSNGKLAPLALIFTGGALTKGNQLNGADLRSISESEFLQFVRKLQPHLQEVQLATSRIFKLSTDSPRLLSLITNLSSIGVVYERPPLRYFFGDIVKVISYWRNDANARNCEIYIRRPRDSSIEDWRKLGKIDEFRIDPVSNEQLATRIIINHCFLIHIDLIFHLH